MKITWLGQAGIFFEISGKKILIDPYFTKIDYLAQYFEELRQTVKFKKWIFGHYHGNKNVTADEILIYEQIIRIV